MFRTNNREFLDGPKPRIIGHAGAGGVAPPDTVIAVETGIEQGAQVIEFDIRLSADERVVSTHNSSMDKTSNGKGKVGEMTVSELQRLDAGYWFTADHGLSYPYRGRGVTVPTMEEVLEVACDKPLVVDLKLESTVLVEKAVRILRQQHRLDESILFTMPNGIAKPARELVQPAITSFSGREVKLMLLYALLGREHHFPIKGNLYQVPLATWPYSMCARRLVDAVHACGVEVNPWTIDDEADMQRMLDLGVDAITTNYPGKLRELIQSLGSVEV